MKPLSRALDPRHEVCLVEGVDARARRWVADERGELALPGDVETVSVTVDARALKSVIFVVEPVRRTSSLPRPRR